MGLLFETYLLIPVLDETPHSDKFFSGAIDI